MAITRRVLLLTTVAGFGAALLAPPAHATEAVTIAVGQRPAALAVNSATGMVYVANSGSGTVSVIEGDSNLVIATVEVGGPLSDITVDERTSRVYVANAKAGTVTVLDGDSNAVVGVIASGPGTAFLDVDEKDGTVYAASSTGQVSLLDALSNTLRSIKPTNVGRLAGARVDSGRRLAYFVGDQSRTVEVLDLASGGFLGAAAVGSAPAGLDLHESSNTLYVANSGIHHMSVVDGATRTEKATVLLRSAASSVAVHQASNTIYTNGGPNGLVRIDGKENKVSGELPLGTNAGDVAVDQRTRLVYVTNPQHDTVTAIAGF